MLDAGNWLGHKLMLHLVVVVAVAVEVVEVEVEVGWWGEGIESRWLGHKYKCGIYGIVLYLCYLRPFEMLVGECKRVHTGPMHNWDCNYHQLEI